jgi:large repetitive protein
MSRGDGVLRAPGTGISGRTVALVLGSVLALSAVVVATRQDGLPTQLIANLRGTRWLVYEPQGLAVLADSVTGRVVVQLSAANLDDELVALQGSSGAYLINRDRGEASTIDEQNVSLDAGRAVPSLVAESRDLVTGVGVNGAVAASLNDHRGVLVPPTGPVTELELDNTVDVAQVATDGAMWSVDTDTATVFRQDGSAGESFTPANAPATKDDVSLTTVGEDAVVLDRGAGEIRWLPGDTTVRLPSGAPNVDAVLQEPGAEAGCVWVARVDQMLCVGRGGVQQTVQIDSLVIDRGARLAVTNGHALLLRADLSVATIRLTNGASEPVRYTWTQRATPVLSVDETGIWLDDPRGPSAVVVTSLGAKLIKKVDPDAPQFGEDGTPISGDDGQRISGGLATSEPSIESTDQAPPPDDDGIQEPPIANDDSASAREGIEVAVIATANDYDPDGDPISLVSAENGRRGRVSILDGTTLVYTPDQGFVGEDSFTYTIEDPSSLSDTATVRVEMIALDASNRPPIAASDTAETAVGKEVLIDVLRNDFDPERTQLSISSIEPPPPTQGTVERTILADGRTALKFLPAATFAGAVATFSYRASDADDGLSNPATVTVDVAAADVGNRSPVAVPDTARTRRQQSLQIDVLANDRDPDNDQLIITDVTLVDPRHGEARKSGRSILFVAAASAPDTVQLRYTISDGHDGTATGQVLVKILPDNQPNGPPVTTPDDYGIPSRTFVFDPTLNDKDPDNDTLTLVSVSQPGDGGTTTRLAGNKVSFSPTPGRSGTFRFTYRISDGFGHEASGQVAITILTDRRPDGPTAADDQAETTVNKPVTINVLSNDSDPAGDQLQIDGQPNCQYGTCTVNNDQTITFTPPKDAISTYRFTYRVRNSVGQQAEATVVVQVQPNPVTNLAPVAQPDRIDVPRGGTVTIDVLKNDEDDKRETLRVTNVTQPSSGQAERVNQSIQYTSSASGPDVVTFGYTIQDDANRSASSTVTVTIFSAENQVPITTEDARTVTQGTPVELDVVENDNDDGPNEELRLVGTPTLQSGDAAISRAGTRVLRVVPAPGFVGTIRVRYVIEDAGGLTAPGTFTLTVIPPANGPPSADDDVASTNQGSAKDIPVLVNDSDPDGDQMTVEIANPPNAAQGTAVVLGDGKTIRFTPAVEFSGQAVFQYRAVDSKGNRSSTATVRVTVVACAQGTPAVQDHNGLFTGYMTPIEVQLLAADQLDYALSVGNESGGSVSDGGAPGRKVFTPFDGNNGSGSFTFTVTNSCGVSRSASVSIDVNRAPLATGGLYATSTGVPVTLAVGQIASDDEALVIASASPGNVVQVAAGGGSLTFNSATAGPVSVSYTVRDPGGLTASGTLQFDVQPVTNAPPTAGNLNVAMAPGAVATPDWLSQASDPDGPASGLTVQVVTATSGLTSDASAGSVSAAVSSDGRTLSITSTVPANGVGQLTYRVIDQLGQPSNTATINVLVNRGPTAQPGGNIGFYGRGDSDDFRPNVSDPDGNAVTLSNPTSDSAYVTTFLHNNDEIRFEVAQDAPSGIVEIRYTATDSLGHATTGTFSITIVGI